jgi:predicted Ser/Thr protein kinase
MSSNYSAEQHNRKFKNHYELKEELGKGGFGTVRRCVEKKPEETEYAVKVNNTPDRKDSMIMEAKICLALCQPTGHINIVNLYDHISNYYKISFRIVSFINVSFLKSI